MINAEEHSLKLPLRYIKPLLALLGLLLLVTTTSMAQDTTNSRIKELDRNQGNQGRQIKLVCTSTSSIESDSAVFFIDGKEVTAEALKSLDPEKIESIQIVKNESSAAFLEGRKAQGLVIITTKANANASDVKSFNEKVNNITSEAQPDPQTIKINPKEAPNQDNALILLDGEQISRSTMDALAPENIKSVDILKGAAATKKYGEKGKNGVIIITRKQTKK